MPLKRETLAFTLYLGALSAIPPLSIDMGLPGIPSIERSFPDAAGSGSLTLSLFLAGFAVAPLVGGPIADRFGRRPSLLVGLLLFSLAATACVFAPSFKILLVCRLLQGIAAGGCVVLPLAIVRDLFDGASARTRLSQVAAVLGIAPMLAPVLGGFVMTISGWREIFACQAALGIVLLVATAIGFEESLAPENRRALSPAQWLGGFSNVLSDRNFLAFTLVYAFGFAGMFSYISGSPSVLMQSIGLSETTFSLLFALTSCGVLLGSLLSGSLAKRNVASRKILNVGLTAMTIAGLVSVALVMAGIVHTFTLMPLVALVIFFFGLISPSANHEAMRNLGHVAGSAAGIMRCIQMFLGALASALIAFFQPLGEPALVMTGLMAVSVVAAGLIYLWLGRAKAPIEPTHA